MTLFSNFLYILAIILFFLYLLVKFTRRAYLFSTFNIGMYIYTFTLLISPIFCYMNQGESLNGFINYSMQINLIGYCVYIMTLAFTEFSRGKCVLITQMETFINKNIGDSALGFVFFLFSCVILIIFFVYAGGVPLFNGKRTFYYDKPISPVYMLAEYVISLIMVYYTYRVAMYGKGKIIFFMGVFLLLCEAHRGPVLVDVLLPFLLVRLYIGNKRCKAVVNGNQPQTFTKELRVKKKKIWKKVMVYVFLVLFLGVFIQFLRGGMQPEFSATAFLGEIFLGNTFSDIRDGAYVLMGFDSVLHHEYLLGKTYLAGIIAFLPSGWSEYKRIWTWGRFSTKMLFGWDGHLGLRGGNAMESYVNFSWLGVLFFSILQGCVSGFLERRFYKIFVSEEDKIQGKEVFAWKILSDLLGAMCISSGLVSFYVTTCFLFVFVLISDMFRRKRIPKLLV